jgi:hypothetical protein
MISKTATNEDTFAARNFERSFDLIHEEIKSIFEFVQPSDSNLPVYSLRIAHCFVKCCNGLNSFCGLAAVVFSSGIRVHATSWNNVEFDSSNFFHFHS